MRDLTRQTSVGRVFHALLATARWPFPHAQGCDGPKKAVTYDDLDRRDIVKFNARLDDLRHMSEYGFRVRDIDSYSGNCSGHFIEITDPIAFRMLLEDINRRDLKRMKKMTAAPAPAYKPSNRALADSHDGPHTS